MTGDREHGSDLGLVGMARALAAGDATASEVLEDHLARLEAVRPAVRAVVALRADGARAEAAAADREREAGQVRGPLHGVPVTIKDWIETDDLPCAAGIESRRHLVPTRDATVVARLRAAGAIVVAKTKVGTDDAVHPHARNPWDHDRTTGGSTAGEAALVAVGASPLGIGSDSGGSLRWPAHCCGIATLRPTTGLVPITGHVPRINPLQDPRTTIGPMARRIDDLALVLPLLVGPDGRDTSVVPVPLGRHDEVDLSRLRVAVHTGLPGLEPAPDVAAAVERAAAALAAEGAQVVAARPEGLDEALTLTVTYWRRRRASGWSTWGPASPSELSADEIERSLFHWDRFRRRLARFHVDHDVLLGPVAASTAPPWSPEVPVETWAWTVPASLTGQPVVVCPAGPGRDGLPIGVQLAARRFEDHVALAAARVVEAATGGHRPPPLVGPGRSGTAEPPSQ